MAYFVWDESLDVGVDKMNDEHKKLIGFMNDLHELQEQAADASKLKRAMKRLGDYTVEHFKDEEAYMESIEYEARSRHKIIHEQLLAKFNGFVEALDKNGVLEEDFFSFLRSWLVAHLKGIDRKYGNAG